MRTCLPDHVLNVNGHVGHECPSGINYHLLLRSPSKTARAARCRAAAGAQRLAAQRLARSAFPKGNAQLAAQRLARSAPAQRGTQPKRAAGSRAARRKFWAYASSRPTSASWPPPCLYALRPRTRGRRLRRDSAPDTHVDLGSCLGIFALLGHLLGPPAPSQLEATDQQSSHTSQHAQIQTSSPGVRGTGRGFEGRDS